MNYSSFRFIKVLVIERAMPWLMSRLRGDQMTSRRERRAVADALASLPEIDNLPEIRFDLSFLEVPEIKFDSSFLDQPELVDVEGAEVGDLHMGNPRGWQERDLDEGFRQRATEVARHATERQRAGVRPLRRAASLSGRLAAKAIPPPPLDSKRQRSRHRAASGD